MDRGEEISVRADIDLIAATYHLERLWGRMEALPRVQGEHDKEPRNYSRATLLRESAVSSPTSFSAFYRQPGGQLVLIRVEKVDG